MWIFATRARSSGVAVGSQESPHRVILASAIARAHLPVESMDLAATGLDGKGLLPILIGYKAGENGI